MTSEPTSSPLPRRLRLFWLQFRRYCRGPQLRGDVIFFATFFLVVVLINAVVVANVCVPTGSMRDTIRENERFVVRKIGYGLQNPLEPRRKVTFHGNPVLKWKEPHRGDIVVFVPPEAAQTDEKYVKRLIGESGDRIAVRAGRGVYVNGQLLDEPYLLEKPRYSLPPFRVPEDKVFVLGDNRNNSFDSHAWGLLDRESIQGVMTFRYWPLQRMGHLGNDAPNKNRRTLMMVAVVGVAVFGYRRWRRGERRDESEDDRDATA